MLALCNPEYYSFVSLYNKQHILFNIQKNKISETGTQVQENGLGCLDIVSKIYYLMYRKK